MRDNSQHAFRTTELDRDLLSTPFKIQTKWHVITGAPCCGKTTLIDQLAGKGFRTFAETARQYFERETAKGRTVDELYANPATLHRGIKAMQALFERGLRPIDLAFLDRALPDSLAFFRVGGMNPNEILPECFHHRYASVFMLDPLPFQSDEERIGEIAEIVGYLDEWHARDYSALGYNVVRVPVLPPEERLAFVLERLSEQGLI